MASQHEASVSAPGVPVKAVSLPVKARLVRFVTQSEGQSFSFHLLSESRTASAILEKPQSKLSLDFRPSEVPKTLFDTFPPSR
jgi:hypothetical protein